MGGSFAQHAAGQRNVTGLFAFQYRIAVDDEVECYSGQLVVFNHKNANSVFKCKGLVVSDLNFRGRAGFGHFAAVDLRLRHLKEGQTQY